MYHYEVSLCHPFCKTYWPWNGCIPNLKGSSLNIYTRHWDTCVSTSVLQNVMIFLNFGNLPDWLHWALACHPVCTAPYVCCSWPRLPKWGCPETIVRTRNWNFKAHLQNTILDMISFLQQKLYHFSTITDIRVYI